MVATPTAVAEAPTLSLASAGSIGYSAARMRVRRSGWFVLTAGLVWLSCLAGAALPVLGVGCSDVTDTTTDTTTAAAGRPVIEIDPFEFLIVTPGLVCADVPGGMRSYVVTFIDLGPETDDGAPAPGYPITLPSSDPTSCSQRVAFINGVIGHRYLADVDGYEEEPTALLGVCSTAPPYATCISLGKAPLGAGTCEDATECVRHGCYGQCIPQPQQKLNDGVCETQYTVVDNTRVTVDVNVCVYSPVQGDRHMVHASSYAPATPRWTSPANEPCGWLDPAAPGAYERVPISPCAALLDSKEMTPSATGIRVVPTATLGTLSCLVTDADAGTTGTVTTFDVELEKPLGLVLKKDVACKADESVLFEQGVTPGTEYVFKVTAYTGSSTSTTPTAEARCFATAQKGVIVQAKCDPLVEMGASGP